jgi:hypothetical protein
MRLIGYRQLWNHLERGADPGRAVEKAVIATRQLARRQLTWLRAEPGAEWFDAFDPGRLNVSRARCRMASESMKPGAEMLDSDHAGDALCVHEVPDRTDFEPPDYPRAA